MRSSLECFVSSVPRFDIEWEFEELSVVVALGKLIEEKSSSEVGRASPPSEAPRMSIL